MLALYEYVKESNAGHFNKFCEQQQRRCYRLRKNFFELSKTNFSEFSLLQLLRQNGLFLSPEFPACLLNRAVFFEYFSLANKLFLSVHFSFFCEILRKIFFAFAEEISFLNTKCLFKIFDQL